MKQSLVNRLSQIPSSLRSWFEDRLPVDVIVNHLREKTVPRHRHTLWYYLGGLTLFFFVVQILTGFLLMIYYTPTIDGAHQSVLYIVNEVPFGWLIRSIHSWAANLMIATLLLHMVTVFYLQAYRPPRELMWMSGFILLFIILGFGFTGYLLPWDDIAFYATQIGTEVPKSIPVIGPTLVGWLRGGEDIGAATIPRMYTLHVFVLPVATLLLIGIHLFLNQYYGVSKPIKTPLKRESIPFYPNFMLRDFRTWGIALILLLGLAILSPWGLGNEADLLRPAPEGVKPEWYFLPMYQTLKILPSRIWMVDSEALLNIFLMIGGLIVFLLPFLDTKAKNEERNKFVLSAGTIIIVYCIVITVSAYM
jgi:cytochrome b6